MPVDLNANQERRAEVLTQLTGDPRDAELVRFLLQQEVLAHRAAKWSVSESIVDAARPLSGYGHADDVWLLWDAKRADTVIGIDTDLLFPAGVSETIAHVEAGDHPDRDAVPRYLRS